MQNDNFNSPKTLPPSLQGRKKDLGRFYDRLKREKKMEYSQHAKAILAIMAAKTLADMDQVEADYTPQLNAA